jgi:ubiquinone biosynthesis protein
MLRPDEVDQERLERALGQFMARDLNAGASPGVRMFSDLFRIVTDYGLSVPPEVAATFRALAVLEGTLTQLAPGFDLVAEARAFAGGQGPGKVVDPANARQLVTDELTTLLPMLRRLPAAWSGSPAPPSTGGSASRCACSPTTATAAISPGCSTRSC